jgi:hypothetical protein
MVASMTGPGALELHAAVVVPASATAQSGHALGAVIVRRSPRGRVIERCVELAIVSCCRRWVLARDVA